MRLHSKFKPITVNRGLRRSASCATALLTIAGDEVDGAFVIEQDEHFALAEKL